MPACTDKTIVTRKVLFFSFNYPPLDGGISRLCAEIVSGLQRKGVEVRVLSQSRKGPGSHIPPVRESRLTMLRPWRELAALRELRRIDSNEIVICGLWYPEGLLAILANVQPGVVLAHGLELKPRRQCWRRPMWRWLMQRVLRRAGIVIADSGYTAELVRSVAPGARVRSVPLAVDHLRFRPGDRLSARRNLGIAEDKRVIITVSRVTAHKNHRLVLKALAAMPEDTRSRFVYVVAGRGRAMMATLQQEADGLGVGQAVRWLGYVPEAELPRLYQSADLFVLCTREDRNQPNVEGFGLVFLEAQACGVPVVGARTGGIPDAVKESQGGWLIDQDDAAALSAILMRLGENPEEFRRMGILARHRVERECTWDSYMDRLSDALSLHGLRIY
jgi:phosphatidylinositol alpha-1,6-mannosyltransferase